MSVLEEPAVAGSRLDRLLEGAVTSRLHLALVLVGKLKMDSRVVLDLRWSQVDLDHRVITTRDRGRVGFGENHLATFGLGKDGLVFTARDKGPVRKTTFNSGPSKTARSKAGADNATFHWLRHYYASLLIRYGESVKTVQARLGHATAAETLDTYGHLWPDSDDRTRQAASTALWVPESAAQNGGTTRGQRASDTPA